MPRQARLDAPGTLHHVMIRGIEGSRIFEDDQDRSDFISQSEEEGVAEDEAAFEASGQTVMEVPTEIVPAIRELIAKHKAA